MGALKFYSLYMGKIVTVHTIFGQTLKNLFIFIRARNHIVIATSYQNRAYVEVSWRLRTLISGLLNFKFPFMCILSFSSVLFFFHSLLQFQWPRRKNHLLQSIPGIRPTFRGILFLQQIQRTSSTSLSPQPIETIIITQVRSQPMTERHRSFWCGHYYQLR